MIHKRTMITLLFFSIMLTSCIEQHHLEEMAIITTSAIDLIEEDKIETTFVIYEFTKDKAEAKIVSGKGSTIKGANVDASKKIDFYLAPGKLQVELFGVELAKKGLLPHIDTLSRDANLPDTMYLALGSKSAKEIVNSQESSTISVNIGQFLHEVIKKNSKQRHFPEITLNTFLMALNDAGKDPILPIFTLDGGNIPKITSIALFKDDKYVGKLPSEDILLLDLTQKGKIKEKLFETSFSMEPFNKYIKREKMEKDDIHIAFEILRGKGRNKLIDKDQLKFETEINMDLNLVEISQELHLEDAKVINLVEKEVEKKLISRFEKLMEKLQELNSDAIGYGDLYRMHTKRGALTKNEWKEKFPNIKVTFKVNAKIIHHGEHS